MYIDFQQNRVCRSVKTVHTNLFAQYRKFHKFATTNSNFEKKTILLDTHHHKMYMYIIYLFLFYLNHTQWHSRKHKNTMV